MSERKASLKDLLEKFLGKKRSRREFEVEILDLSGDRRYIKIGDKTIPRENILQIDPERYKRESRYEKKNVWKDHSVV